MNDSLSTLLRYAVSESVREALSKRHLVLVAARIAAIVGDKKAPPIERPLFVILRWKFGAWNPLPMVHASCEAAEAYVKSLSRRDDARLPHVVVEVEAAS